MFRVLGSHSSFLPRRDVLRVGALAPLAATLAGSETGSGKLAHAADVGALGGFGTAKRILLIYLQGAASQFETWDPKPEAPAEIRGQWSPLSTSVPGT